MRKIKKNQNLRAYPDFLPHGSRRRPLVWFSLKRTTCSRPKPQLSIGNPGKPTCPGVPWRDLQFRGPFMDMFSTERSTRRLRPRRPRNNLYQVPCLTGKLQPTRRLGTIPFQQYQLTRLHPICLQAHRRANRDIAGSAAPGDHDDRQTNLEEASRDGRPTANCRNYDLAKP